jgi:hypothetical protein
VSTHAIVGADPHWIDYVAAFGTVLASFVAVGIALWARRRDDRQRPELSLVYDGGEGDDFMAGFRAGNREQHLVRLRVANRWGKRSAEDVEVLVAKVVQSDREAGAVNGYSFVWSNQLDGEGRPLSRITIPPGVARHFDLLALVEPNPPDGGYSGEVAEPGEYPASVELALRPKPADRRHMLGAGIYTLILALTGRDTDAVHYAVDVTFDGKWWRADSVRSHLKVAKPVVVGYVELEPHEGRDRFLRVYGPGRARLVLRLRRLNPIARRRARRAERASRERGPDDPHHQMREAVAEREAREDARGGV